MTGHIELFPGSKADLEDMTGENYQAMKSRSGGLMRVETTIFAFGEHLPTYPTTIKDRIDEELRRLVRHQGAHALVHLNYFHTSGETSGQETKVVCGSGYLIKRV